MIPFYGVFDWTGTVPRATTACATLLERRVVKRRIADAPEVFRVRVADGHIGPTRRPRSSCTATSTRSPRSSRRATFVARAPGGEPRAGGLRRAPGAHHTFEVFNSDPHDAHDRGRRPLPRVAAQRCGPPGRSRPAASPTRSAGAVSTGDRSDTHGAYGAMTQRGQRDQHPVVVDPPAREVAPRLLAVGAAPARPPRRAARRPRRTPRG